MTPAPDDRQLELYDVLLAALPEDEFVRYDVEAGTFEAVEVAAGRAAAWQSWSDYRQARWVTAIAADPDDPGDVAEAAALVARLGEQRGPARPFFGITVPRGAADLLPASLPLRERGEWDWWFTESPPPVAGSWPTPVDLPGDDPRLGDLLAVASPDAPIRPGDPRVARWAAYLDDAPDLAATGGLAALVAVTHLRSGAAHLNDVATHPARRGRGLAAALCGSVTRDALDDGRPAVTLGMYAANDAARALYASLGFTRTHRNTSGALG